MGVIVEAGRFHAQPGRDFQLHPWEHVLQFVHYTQISGLHLNIHVGADNRVCVRVEHVVASHILPQSGSAARVEAFPTIGRTQLPVDALEEGTF